MAIMLCFTPVQCHELRQGELTLEQCQQKLEDWPAWGLAEHDFIKRCIPGPKYPRDDRHEWEDPPHD